MTDRAQMRQLLGVLVIVLGACLSAAGTFLQLYRVTYDFGQIGQPSEPPPFELRFTSWQVNGTVDPVDQPSLDSDVPQYGYPAVFAAVLLLVCAVVLLRAASTSPRVVAVARFTSVGAAMLLAGAIWSVGQFIWSQVSRTSSTSPLITFVGPGFWVLVIGAGVALAGSLLVQQLPSGPSSPTGPVIYQLGDDEFFDTDTSPLGFAVPVFATLAAAITHHPSGADPSTVEPKPN